MTLWEKIERDVSHTSYENEPAVSASALSSACRIGIINFFSSAGEVGSLVRQYETLGFNDCWVGEHRTTSQVRDPLALAYALLGRTLTIGIGTGAIGLGPRKPDFVSGATHGISQLYEQRFELGITNKLAISSVGEDDHFEGLAKELTEKLIEDHAFTNTIVPPVHVMVKSIERAEMTGAMGLGMVTSFHHGAKTDDILNMLGSYLESFSPSAFFREPYHSVVRSGVLVEDRKFAKEMEVSLHDRHEKFAQNSDEIQGVAVDPDNCFFESDANRVRQIVERDIEQCRCDRYFYLPLPASNERHERMVYNFSKALGLSCRNASNSPWGHWTHSHNVSV